MSTKNIECQLAQGQIGRYLNGERFSPDAIRQLESHVADCDECSELVTRRRQALVAMLGERSGNLAVVSPSAGAEKAVEKPADEPLSINKKLIEAISKASTIPRSAETAPTTTPTSKETPSSGPTKIQALAQVFNSKPLMYCAGLAAALLAMSYFSRGALKTFGPTADHAVSAEANPPTAKIQPLDAQPATTTSTTPKPVVLTSSPTAKKNATVLAPIVHKSEPIADESDASADQSDSTPSPTPIKSVVHRITHRPVHRTATRAAVRIRVRHLTRPRFANTTRRRSRVSISRAISKPTSSSIRVYDPQGRPIQ